MPTFYIVNFILRGFGCRPYILLSQHDVDFFSNASLICGQMFHGSGSITSHRIAASHFNCCFIAFFSDASLICG